MDDHDRRVIQAMRLYGGNFDRALADVAGMADDFNLDLIKATWPGTWVKYAQIADRASAAAPGNVQ